MVYSYHNHLASSMLSALKNTVVHETVMNRLQLNILTVFIQEMCASLQPLNLHELSVDAAGKVIQIVLVRPNLL